MKLLLVLSPLVLLFSSCSKEEAPATQAPAAPSEATTAVAYPLDVCLVSGEELGSMGEPVVIQHEGREIKFCCAECEPTFKENPEKYLSKLEPGTAE